jgi:hypothetical protein
MASSFAPTTPPATNTHRHNRNDKYIDPPG